MAATANTESALLGLIGELRNEIYRLVLLADEDDYPKLTATGMIEPALLSVCKQVSKLHLKFSGGIRQLLHMENQCLSEKSSCEYVADLGICSLDSRGSWTDLLRREHIYDCGGRLQLRQRLLRYFQEPKHHEGIRSGRDGHRVQRK